MTDRERDIFRHYCDGWAQTNEAIGRVVIPAVVTGVVLAMAMLVS